jgi:hypothetical protein
MGMGLLPWEDLFTKGMPRNTTHRDQRTKPSIDDEGKRQVVKRATIVRQFGAEIADAVIAITCVPFGNHVLLVRQLAEQFELVSDQFRPQRQALGLTTTAPPQHTMASAYAPPHVNLNNNRKPLPEPIGAAARYPLMNIGGHNHHNMNMARQPPPPNTYLKPLEKPKDPPPSSPPLPRQNSKTVPPSPPKVITDAANARQYARVGFLGEVRLPGFSAMKWTAN